jgi:hypothetical protein
MVGAAEGRGGQPPRPAADRQPSSFTLAVKSIGQLTPVP